MPANTPKGYPYPLGTDLISAGDDAIHNLGLLLDKRLGGGVVSITATITFPAAASANVPGATATVAITWPVGVFTNVPNVAWSVDSGEPFRFACACQSITANGANLYGQSTYPSAIALTARIIAHQP